MHRHLKALLPTCRWALHSCVRLGQFMHDTYRYRCGGLHDSCMASVLCRLDFITSSGGLLLVKLHPDLRKFLHDELSAFAGLCGLGVVLANALFSGNVSVPTFHYELQEALQISTSPRSCYPLPMPKGVHVLAMQTFYREGDPSQLLRMLRTQRGGGQQVASMASRWLARLSIMQGLRKLTRKLQRGDRRDNTTWSLLPPPIYPTWMLS